MLTRFKPWLNQALRRVIKCLVSLLDCLLSYTFSDLSRVQKSTLRAPGNLSTNLSRAIRLLDVLRSLMLRIGKFLVSVREIVLRGWTDWKAPVRAVMDSLPTQLASWVRLTREKNALVGMDETGMLRLEAAVSS